MNLTAYNNGTNGRQWLLACLTACLVQDWLYEEGEDETKSTYIAKLEELRQVGDPVERRGIEFQMRPQAAARLRETAHHYASQASSSDPKLAHIAAADKQKVLPLAHQCKRAVTAKNISKVCKIVVGEHYVLHS